MTSNWLHFTGDQRSVANTLKVCFRKRENREGVQSEMNVRKCSMEWKRKPHTGPGFLKYLNHWGPAERTWQMKSPGIWLFLPLQGDKERVEEKGVPFPYHRGMIGDCISNHVHTLLLCHLAQSCPVLDLSGSHKMESGVAILSLTLFRTSRISDRIKVKLAQTSIYCYLLLLIIPYYWKYHSPQWLKQRGSK